AWSSCWSSRRASVLTNRGFDTRVLQQAATSHIQSGTSTTRHVWTSSRVQLRDCPPAPYECGMHPHGLAVPLMPGIVDFTQIPNMGLLLTSCIIWNVITKDSVTGSSFPLPRTWGTLARSGDGSASGECSITIIVTRRNI